MLSAQQVKERATPLLQPISSEQPAGANASFDPRYEGLRSAMAGLDSPTGEEVQWPDVLQTGQSLLTSATKDLLVATYTAYAWVQTEQLMGLAVGIELLQGLISDYWESMYPPAARMRGRGNALDWLVARLEIALPSLQGAATDRAELDMLLSQWESFARAARERLGEHCPAMEGVTTALKRIQLSLPETTPSPNPQPQPTPQPQPPPQPQPTPTPQPQPEPEPAPQPDPEPPAEPVADDPLAALRSDAAKWLEPIGGEPGVGDDPRYQPQYEAARAEIAKIDALTDELPEWESVVSNAGQVLRELGKDLLMGCYLAIAQLELEGLAALPRGLVLVATLLEQYGDDLYPSRPRGRGNAVGWLVGQAEHRLGQIELTAKDRPTVLQLEKAAKHLSSVVRDRLDDAAPGMSPLTERVTRMLLAIPESKPEPPPPPPKPAAAPPPPAPTAAPARPAPPSAPMPTAPAADVSNAEDVSKFLLDTGRSLVTAAGVLRRADIASASAYRLLRSGLWLHLQSTPPADAGGKTQIPPLPAARRQQYETILANGKWAAAIEETESALTQFRFCLDLNRMTVQALRGLGHDAAVGAVVAELRALLHRMADLPDLTAADGSPLADAETRSWLQSEVLTQAGGSGVAAQTEDDGDAMAEARELMKEGKAVEAMKRGQQAIDAATSPRSRYTRQLSLAHMCLEANQPVLARGMFAALERELRERNLLEWERALARRCLEGFVRSIRAAHKAGNPYPHAEEIFERLCLVDPTAAARLSG